MFSERTVVMLSFEGPDVYAQAGGLGVRAAELSAALAAAGAATHLYFIGDPRLPSTEERAPGLTLHRWSQWISAYHPGGVYDGEWGKINDYTASVPAAIIDDVVAPAVARDQRVLVLAEEWHATFACIALDRLLRERDLRRHVTMLWNANNTFGFEHIDWIALQAAATVTTVSKYMKFELAVLTGAQALVIPNGIPQRLIGGPDPALVKGVRGSMKARPLLAKVGRFDPDKRWLQAIDAVAEVRAMGLQARLLVRGGKEPHGGDVFERALQRGLSVEDVVLDTSDTGALIDALAQTQADVVNLRVFLDPRMLYAIYAAADAVLANSGKEPFGLVGLEVMAAGGLAVCGATGEEYAQPFGNAIVCDTEDGRELATYVAAVYGEPERAQRLRAAGVTTAERFTWPSVLDVLEQKIAYVDRTR